MRFVIGLIIVVGLSIGAYQLYEYWGKFKDTDDTHNAAAASAPAPQPMVNEGQLSGLPPKLGPLLDEARKRGAPGLHDFLAAYGNKIEDPRLAWIQLDYVELLSQSSPGQARQIFLEVKNRVPPDSPVYPRVQALEKTYE